MSTSPEEHRATQTSLYGAPVDALAAEMRALLGLDDRGVAGVIGVSAPMFADVRAGRRSRIGNPVATLRLQMLRDLCRHLREGRASADDVPLALEQIRVATAPAPAGPEPVTSDPFALTDDQLREAARVVRRHVAPTPARRWPLLEAATGVETWVKHENHCPTGAFKVRGGLLFVDRLLASGHRPAGLITATRGNHGQSVAYAGAAGGLPVTVVVPEGNSPDKNEAMAGYGARLVVAGHDFQAAREHAAELAERDGLLFVPSFAPDLVTGVATYAAELHAAVPGLDVVYVPVGLGSGICANLAVRDLLGLDCEVVGVVAERAPAYALSFEAGEPVASAAADTLVDGVACRVPDPEAVRLVNAGAARIVRVSEEQAQAAMTLMYRATHNLAEPAGSLALAGLLADDRRDPAHTRVAVVHTGGNCDLEVLAAAAGLGPGAGLDVGARS
ncbi:threonine dehydratase [Nocardioides sp. CFH 31398]|uniref:threonine dehydratase n=1 Tax=Nocardioides sp. CFH 31398 TaxID=2919579 RepID=UPI001F056120|nr:threonine dehydratase [Nocardioides sp. CFH 31398]MCH1865727.1 threonine dehydratase [Nocardioides sp. CFH 31398]